MNSRFWESELTKQEITNLYNTEYSIKGCIIKLGEDNYRFIDETQSDSYGPYKTQEEAHLAQLEYSKTL